MFKIIRSNEQTYFRMNIKSQLVLLFLVTLNERVTSDYPVSVVINVVVVIVDFYFCNFFSYTIARICFKFSVGVPWEDAYQVW